MNEVPKIEPEKNLSKNNKELWEKFVNENRGRLDEVLCNEEGDWIFIRSDAPGDALKYDKVKVFYGKKGERLNQNKLKESTSGNVEFKDLESLLGVHNQINNEWKEEAIKKAEEELKKYINYRLGFKNNKDEAEEGLSKHFRGTIGVENLPMKIESFKKELQEIEDSQKWAMPEEIRKAKEGLEANGLKKEAKELKNKAMAVFLEYARFRLEVAEKLMGSMEFAEGNSGSVKKPESKADLERNKFDEFKKAALELAIKYAENDKKHEALYKMGNCVTVNEATESVKRALSDGIITKDEAGSLLNILGAEKIEFLSEKERDGEEIKPKSALQNEVENVLSVEEQKEEPQIVRGSSFVTGIPAVGAGMVWQMDSEQDAQRVLTKNDPQAVSYVASEKSEKAEEAKKELPKIKKHYIISADQIVERYARTIAKEKTRELLHRPEENMSSGSRAKSIWNHISAPFRHPRNFVKFAQKSWVRVMEAGYEEKFYREALEKITENQNLLLEFDPSARLRKKIDAKAGNKDDHYEILDKIIEQYSNEIAEQEEIGNNLDRPEVNAEFQKLIANCCLGGWERSMFDKELKISINKLKKEGHIKNDDFLGASKRSEEEVSEGRMYASNLWGTVKDYRSQIEEKMKELAGEHELDAEQEEKLREHAMGVIKLDIQLGAKISDIHNRRPQGTLNATDKLISWAQRTPILGRIAPNPGTMAFIGAGVGAFVSRRLASKTAMAGVATIGLATGAWAPVIGAGVIAGTFGALRRNLELKKDRAMHQQQRVLGEEYKDFRRENMENYQYDVKSTKELRENLELIKNSGEYAKLTPEQKKELADMLARFKLEVNYDREYRTEKKPNRTVDLISVPAEEGERYGTTLISKTKLKKELYEYLRANDLIKGENHELSGDQKFGDLFNEQYENLADNITKTDKKFDWHRRRSALLIGALTAVSGSTAAIAGQEFMGFLRGNGGNNYTALDSLRDLWREHVSGRPTKMSETVSQLFFQGKNLSPGENTINLGGKDIKLSVIMDSKTGAPKIDIAKSSKTLPDGFRLSSDGSQLFHKIPGKPETREFSNWHEFAKALGHDTEQKISYGEGFYQKTAPEKGIRAMVESAKNLLHNKKLNSNLTELMMSYRQGDGGKVIVDASKIIGKELIGRSGGDSVNFGKALEDGKVFLNLALDNNINGGDGSQFNPIMLPVGKDGTVEVPEKLAKVFFGFKDGKLLQGSGNHHGLHQLVLDTGQERSDRSKIVRGIAATLGEKPEMETEVIIPGKTETFNFNLQQGKQFDVPYAAPALAHGPRWQLENEAKSKEARRKNKEEDKKEAEPPKQAASAAGSSQEEAENKKEDSQDAPPKGPSHRKSREERFNEFKEEKRKKEEDERKINEKKEEEQRQNEERRKRQAIVTGVKRVKSAVEEKFSKPKEKNVDEIAAKDLGIPVEKFRKAAYHTKKLEKDELVEILTKVLGISKNASKKEIKKAYHKKTRAWHTDTGKTSHEIGVNNAKFVLINNIYDALFKKQRSQFK